MTAKERQWGLQSKLAPQEQGNVSTKKGEGKRRTAKTKKSGERESEMPELDEKVL